MNNKIWQYLNNEMPLNKRLAFESEINNSHEMQKEIALHKDLDNFIYNLHEHNEIKTLVTDTYADFELESQNKKTSLTRLKWVAVAASVLLILGVFIARTMVVNQVVHIYSQNFAAYVPENIVRSAAMESEFSQWNALYTAEEYQKAIEQFKALPVEYLTNAKVIIMYSCALMEKGDYKLALDRLNIANTENRTLVAADVIWYKALCYLKLNEIDKAILALDTLSKTSKIYGSDADAMIKKLKRKLK